MRRFSGLILFVWCWAILIWAPPFAVQTQRAWKEKNDPYFIPDPLSREHIQRLATASKADLFWKIEFIEAKTLFHPERDWKQSEREKLLELEGLVRQYPDNQILRRFYLMKVLRGRTTTFGNRTGSQRETLLPAERREASLQIALEGEKQDPQNGFYPWVSALLLWDLKRTADSLNALQRAGKCSHFEDGIMDFLRWSIQEQSRFRRFDWLGKLSLSAAILLPHLGQMRALGREVKAMGVRDYARGDKREAYRKWRIVLLAGRNLRVGNSRGDGAMLIENLVGQAIQSLVWNGLRPNIKGDESHERSRPSFEAFVGRARADGQNEIARLAQREWNEISQQRKAQSQIGFYDLGFFNFRDFPMALPLVQSFWAGGWVMRWSFAGAVFWLLGWLILRCGRDYSLGSFARSVVFWTTLLAGFLAVGVGLGIGKESLGFYQGDEDMQMNSLFRTWPWALATCVPIGAFVLACLGISRLEISRKPVFRWRDFSFSRSESPFLKPALCALVGALITLAASPLLLEAGNWGLFVFFFVILATLTSLGVGLWRARKGAKRSWKHILVEAPTRVSGGVALGLSLLFFLANLVFLPTQIALEKRCAEYIRLGEMDFLAKYPPN